VQDASGDIHVSLDSSAPCWNDNRGVVVKLTEAPSTSVFSKESYSSVCILVSGGIKALALLLQFHFKLRFKWLMST
jgi:hypothetical protein